MAENSAQIDLKANPETLKDGIAEGTKFIEDFAAETIKSMETSEVSVEKLEASFKDLVEQLSKVIKETGESTNTTLKDIEANEKHQKLLAFLGTTIKDNIVTIGVLTAVVIKSGGTMAEKAAKVGALIKALGVLGAVAINTTISLSKGVAPTLAAGKAVTSYGYAIGAATVRTALYAGNLVKLNPITALVTAGFYALSFALDATGKKFETLNKSSEATKRLLMQFNGDISKVNEELHRLGITAEEAGLKQVTNWTKVEDSALGALDALFKFKYLYKAWAGWASEAWEAVSIGTSRAMDNITNGMKEALDGTKYYFDKAWEGIDITTQYLMGVTKEQYNQNKAIEEATKRQEEYAKKKKQEQAILAEGLKLQADYNYKLQETKRQEDLVLEVNKLKWTGDHNGIAGAIIDHKRYQNELVEDGLYTVKLAKLWEEKNDLLLAKQKELLAGTRDWQEANLKVAQDQAEIAKGFEKTREESAKNNASMGQLLAMLQDEKDILADIADNQNSSSESILKQHEKVKELEARIHSKKLSDIAEEQARKLEAIETEIAKTKALKEIDEDFDAAERENDHEKKMRNLDLQGASLKTLHEERVKYLEEEAKIAQEKNSKDNFGDEVNRKRIQATLAKQLMKENADYERQLQDDNVKVEDLTIQQKFEREQKKLIALGESAKAMSDLRIKAIDEQEKRALAAANSEFEKKKIIWDAERAREREKAGLAKEVAKLTATTVIEPKTRAEKLAAFKKAKAAQEVQKAINKAADPKRQKKVAADRARKEAAANKLLADKQAKAIADARKKQHNLFDDVKPGAAHRGPDAGPKIEGEKTKPVLEKIAEAVTLSAKMDALIAKDLADFGKI